MDMRNSTTFIRWSGRGMFLAILIHGSLGSETTSNIAYLSQVRKRDLWRRPLLCIIVLSSLKPVRIYLRQIFFYVQYVHPRFVHFKTSR